MAVETHETQSGSVTDKATSARQPVTARAIVIGLVLACLFCAITPYNDLYIGATYLAGNYFPIGAFASVLAIVLVVNPALIAAGLRRKILSASETFTVWAMIAVVSGLPSSGLMRYLVPQLVAPRYYESSSDTFSKMFVADIPARLLVRNPNAVKWYFLGLPPGGRVPWSAWFVPMSWWAIFVVAMLAAFFCLSAILRRQWVENERLAFPLVRIPLMLAAEPEQGRMLNSLLRSRLLIGTVAVMTVIHTIRGLHLLYPSVPDIPLSIATGSVFQTYPLSDFGQPSLVIYPMIVGFAFLIPSEVCFSIWFFYIAMHLEVMAGGMLAYESAPLPIGICMAPGFVAYQEAGGAAALVISLLFAMRSHLKAVWRKAVHGDGIDDSGEPMPYRLAVVGLAAALTVMCCWLVFVAQVSPSMALVVVAGGTAIFVMLSWIVGQSGLLFLAQSFVPSQIYSALAGTANFAPTTLIMAAMSEHIGWYDSRELMMPTILNSLKGASDLRLDSRRLTAAQAIGVGLCLIVAAVAAISLPYTHGGVAGMDQWTYVTAPQMVGYWAHGVLMHPGSSPPDLVRNLLIGAAVVVATMLFRSRLPAFPLHAAGFVVAGTYPVYVLWFSLFIGWAIKVPIIRYGGAKAFRLMLPLFVGLIVADGLNAVVWTIVGAITHTGYNILPG